MNNTEKKEWAESQMFVLNELTRLADSQEHTNKILNEICISMAVEKDRLKWLVSGVSVVVSMIMTIIGNALYMLFGRGH